MKGKTVDFTKPLPLAHDRISELVGQGMTMLAAMQVQRDEAIAWGVANGKLVTKPGRKKG